MRTWWLWASVVALCVSPTLAEARERARERGDGGGRHSSQDRRSERGQRDRGASSRAGSDHGSRRQERSSGRPSFTPRQRSDSGAEAGSRSSRNDRSDRRDRPRASSGWTRGDSSRRGSGYSDRGSGYSDRGSGYSDRGWTSRRSGDGWGRSRGDEGRSRHSFRSAPRSNWPSRSFRRGPRYPAYYRYGYSYRHGYYFPRYYYDYGSYTTHASVRVLVEPPEAEVYVDGYYAGIVDDFDGVFQRLNLTPGSHEITLRLDGYQTWSAVIDAVPDSTVSLHHDMVPGVSGPEIEEYSNQGGDEGPEPPQP